MGRRKPPFFFYFYCRARQRGAFCCRPWRQAPVSTGSALPAWQVSTPRFLSAKRSAVSSLREEVAQRNPVEGVPLDSSRNRGTASLWHPGAARHGHVTSRAWLRTFERSLVGGTTNLADPTRRKANFLWKFLCAGGASADCGGDPIPTAVPPQGFLQSKNALRRRKTVGLLLGSLIVE